MPLRTRKDLGMDDGQDSVRNLLYSVMQDIGRLNQEIAQLKTQPVLTDEIKYALKTFEEKFNRLERGIKNTAPTPTDLGPVAGQIKALQSAVEGYTTAVNNIELPQPPKIDIPKVPDFPDIGPLIANYERLNAAVEALANRPPNNPPTEVIASDPAPREWTFDVKRNASGFIKSVTARAVA